MKQITLPLDEFQQTPVVRLNHLRALLDSGAYIPIWVDDEKLLTDVLGATLVKQNVEFAGFGGKAVGNLYRVTMQIGDLIYEVDDKHHKLNITVPDDESLIRNLRIVDKDGKIHVLCNSAWAD